MAILVADVDAVHDATDPARALFTLSMLTGVVMVAAGLLRLGSVLRFVSNAVMVGFINAVGVNIVLGQLANLTGYSSPHDYASHPRARHGPAPGTARRTVGRDRARHDRADRRFGTDAPRSPRPRRGHRHDLSRRERARLGRRDGPRPGRDLGHAARRRAPGAAPRSVPRSCQRSSLALVGLVQGAGISANFPNEDGSYPDPSRDFTGQGFANIASGALEGMPVGGSVSASAVNKAAGARTRTSLVARAS